MAGARALVVHFSSSGQTEKVAHRMGDVLRKAIPGGHVSVRSVTDTDALVSIDAYDVVVVGCPVYVGRFSPHIVNFVATHSDVLQRKRTAFFSLSLGTPLFSVGLYATDRTGSKAADTVRSFLDAAAWRPHHIAMFAGALRYSKYGWCTKLIMREFARHTGASTDTSQDTEYTDWTQVDAFAEQIAMAAPNRESHDPPSQSESTGALPS